MFAQYLGYVSHNETKPRIGDTLSLLFKGYSLKGVIKMKINLDK